MWTLLQLLFWCLSLCLYAQVFVRAQRKKIWEVVVSVAQTLQFQAYLEMAGATRSKRRALQHWLLVWWEKSINSNSTFSMSRNRRMCKFSVSKWRHLSRPDQCIHLSMCTGVPWEPMPSTWVGKPLFNVPVGQFLAVCLPLNAVKCDFRHEAESSKGHPSALSYKHWIMDLKFTGSWIQIVSPDEARTERNVETKKETIPVLPIMPLFNQFSTGSVNKMIIIVLSQRLPRVSEHSNLATYLRMLELALFTKQSSKRDVSEPFFFVLFGERKGVRRRREWKRKR